MADLRALISVLGEEQRRYTLQTLVSHLAAADRYDRLRALFNDDGWLQVRAEESGFLYDSYLADLSLAWEWSAHPRACSEADRGEDPASIADVARLALIRTSLNSVGGNIPPEIAVRAVETGLWSPERALSVAQCMPRAVHRAQLFTSLLAQVRLSDAQRDRARISTLEAVGEFGDQDDRAEALSALVPHLSPVFSDRAVALARGSNKKTRSRALAAVVPLLAGEPRRTVLMEAINLAHSASSYNPAWHNVAPALDPNLDSDLIARAIERVRKSGDKRTRPLALAALSCRLPEPNQSRIASEALDVLKEIPDDNDRVYAMRDTLQDLSGAAKLAASSFALETALRLPPMDGEGEIPQIVGLLAAVPGLDAGGLERATQAALALRDIRLVRSATVRLLAALAARLEGSKREEVVKAAIELAGRPREEGYDEGEWDVNPLVNVIAMCEGEQRAMVIRKALDRALQLPPIEQRNLKIVSPRAEALAMLAPFLSPELVEKAYLSTHQADDGEARATTLAQLSSHLDGNARKVTMQAAVASLAEIGAGSLRADTLESIAPFLTNDDIAAALDAALGISNEMDRGRALQAVNPHVDEPLTEKALAGTLAIQFEPSRANAFLALIPALPQAQLEYALEKAWAIQWEPGRTKCVAAIAHRLSANRRAAVLEAALEIYRARRPDDMSSDMLIALAPMLIEGQAIEGLRLALALKSDLGCARAIAALSPNIAAEHFGMVVESLSTLGMSQRYVVEAIAGRLETPLLARMLDIVLAGESDFGTADGVVALFPHLDEELRGRAVSAICRKLKDISLVVALEGIAAQLPRNLALAAARAATDIADPALRARAIAPIVPRLEGAERDRLSTAALEAALRPGEDWPRANAIVRLIPTLRGPAKKKAIRIAVRIARSAAKNLKYRDPGSPLLALLPEMRDIDIAAAIESLLAIEPVVRAETFARLTYPMKDSALRVIRRKLIEHLLSIRDGDRAEVLRVFALSLCAPPVLSAKVVADIGPTIIDVTRKWTWP